MDAIIVTNGTAQEIAALVVGLQERQGEASIPTARLAEITRKALDNLPGEGLVLHLREDEEHLRSP